MIDIEIILLKLVVVRIFEITISSNCFALFNKIRSINVDEFEKSVIDLSVSGKWQITVSSQINYLVSINYFESAKRCLCFSSDAYSVDLCLGW